MSGSRMTSEINPLPKHKWIYTTTLWPKVCEISGAHIPMFSKAYVYNDTFNELWATKEALVLARLKGDEV